MYDKKVNEHPKIVALYKYTHNEIMCHRLVPVIVWIITSYIIQVFIFLYTFPPLIKHFAVVFCSVFFYTFAKPAVVCRWCLELGSQRIAAFTHSTVTI